MRIIVNINENRSIFDNENTVLWLIPKDLVLQPFGQEVDLILDCSSCEQAQHIDDDDVTKEVSDHCFEVEVNAILETVSGKPDDSWPKKKQVHGDLIDMVPKIPS